MGLVYVRPFVQIFIIKWTRSRWEKEWFVPNQTQVSNCVSKSFQQERGVDLLSDKAETSTTESTLCIKHEESLRCRFHHHTERRAGGGIKGAGEQTFFVSLGGDKRSSYEQAGTSLNYCDRLAKVLNGLLEQTMAGSWFSSRVW